MTGLSCDMDGLIRKIRDAAKTAPFVIAVDGRCGSGKTTFAENLAAETNAPVIHMDDFFLRPEQRTPERLAEPGGNVDRERLLDEVLLPLRNTGKCRYRPYDCSTGGFDREIDVPESTVYVIEGSYSCHPELWDHCDLHVFLTVSPEEQMRRITDREGEAKAETFRTRWIPMEERYFATFGIVDRCDFVFDTTNQEKRIIMNTFDVLYSRKSVRSYTGELVTEAELSEILKAANAAPVGRARYDYLHMTVITDEDFLNRWKSACGSDPFYGAPVVILVSSEMAGVPEQDNVRYSNAAIVVHNMAIAATELGIGSCHIWGAVRTLNVSPELLAELDLPEGKVPLCAIILGKTDEKYEVRDIPERIEVNYK